MKENLRELNAVLRTAESGARRTVSAAGSLRTAFVRAAAPLDNTLNPALSKLDKLTGGLGSRGGVVKTAAGLDRVKQAAAAAAKSTAKAARSLAAFDEIIRMSKVDDTASKGSSGSSGKKPSGASAKKEAEQAAAEAEQTMQQLFGCLKNIWDSFWAYLRQYYAPAILSWSAAWNRMRDAALAVWEPVRQAVLSLWHDTLAPLGNYLLTEFVPGIVNSFSLNLWPVFGDLGAAAVLSLGNTVLWLAGVIGQAADGVIRPTLEGILTIWNGMMQAVRNAWEVYGKPVCAGIVEAVDNLCGILDRLWTGVVLPLLQGLIQQVGGVWNETLAPLFGELAMYLGSAAELILNLWNRVLAPLLQWLTAALGPMVTQVCLLISGAVTAAVEVVAGLIGTLMTALRGLMDFLSDVLCGRWADAWNGMADTAARVWERITGTIQTAISRLQELVGGFVSGIVESVQNALNAISQLGGVGGTVTKVPSPRGQVQAYSALPSLPRPLLRVPALAQGAVIPPNREFLAVLGDQSSGTNIEAPLSTIQEAVAAVMQDMQDGELAALQQVVAVLRQILEAVYGIHVGDEVIGRAVERYRLRQAIITGGV